MRPIFYLLTHFCPIIFFIPSENIRKQYFSGFHGVRTEAVTQRCSVITVACNFIKRESLAQLFSCEFGKISKNTFSYRTPPKSASIGFHVYSMLRYLCVFFKVVYVVLMYLLFALIFLLQYGCMQQHQL